MSIPLADQITSHNYRYRTVALCEIQPNPHNPRKAFGDEALAELAESIKAHGVLQPLVLTPGQDGTYLIVAGERRYRAAKAAGLTFVPAVVRELSHKEQLEIMLCENLQRADLDPIEEARGIRQLLGECDMTQAELAQRIGKSQPWVANRLRLLRLPESVLKQVESGELSPGHAQILLKYERAPKTVETAAKRIIERKTPVSHAESVIAESYSKKEVRTLQGYQAGPGGSPIFNLQGCADCSSAVNGLYSARLCLNPKCWEEKTAAAKLAAEQRATEIAEQAKAGGTPQLSELKHGTFVDHWELKQLKDQTQCEKCDKRIQVLNSNQHLSREEKLTVCVDPACFAATKKQQEQEARAAAQAVVDKMLAKIAATAEASPEDRSLAFALCYALLYSGTTSGRHPNGVPYGLGVRFPSREEFCKSELGIAWPKAKDDSWYDLGKEPQASAIRDFFENLLCQPCETLRQAIVKWLLIGNDERRLDPLSRLLGVDDSPCPDDTGVLR